MDTTKKMVQFLKFNNWNGEVFVITTQLLNCQPYLPLMYKRMKLN